MKRISWRELRSATINTAEREAGVTHERTLMATERPGESDHDVSPDADPAAVGLPESWQTFEDGTPTPNWVAGLDDVRSERCTV